MTFDPARGGGNGYSVSHASGKVLTALAIVAFFAVGCFVLSAYPDSSVADVTDSGSCGSDLTWSYDSDTLTLSISGTGPMDDYTSSSLRWGGHDGVDILEIHIQDGVTTIGDYAFYSLYQVQSIVLPNTVTTVGKEAFSGCYNLKNLTISESVNEIGQSALYSCFSLEDISVDPNNQIFSSEDCVLFDKNKTRIIAAPSVSGVYNVPDTVITVDDYAFFYNEKLTGVILGDSVKTLGFSAFRACSNLSAVTFDDGLETIAGYVFMDCPLLESVSIPNAVTSIGEWAFYGCSSINSLSLGDSLRTIGDSAFYNCAGITSVIFPETLEHLERQALSGTGITEITICPTLVDVDSDAFTGCRSLRSITVDKDNPVFCSLDGVLFNTDMSRLLFYPEGKTDTSLTIPSTVRYIGEWKWDYSRLDNLSNCPFLQSVTVEDGNPNFISENGVLFDSSKIDLLFYPAGKTDSTYTVPENVTFIESPTMFQGCPALERVTFSSKLTRLGASFPGIIFYDFDGVTELDGTLENMTGSIFERIDSKLTKVRTSISFNSLGGSEIDTIWGTLGDRVSAPEPPTLGGYSFGGWFVDDRCQNEYVFNEDTVLESPHIWLYAKWNKETYTITYELGGGNCSPDYPLSYTVDDEIDLYQYDPPTKDGYVFNVWFYDADCSGEICNGIHPGTYGDITLYAKWCPVQYKISYHTLNESNDSYYTIEDEISLEPLNWAGYNFYGWFDNSSFQGDEITLIPKGTTGDIDLYAEIVVADYTITYELGGGVNDERNPTTYTMFSDEIDIYEPVRKGYTFTGWEDGEGTQLGYIQPIAPHTWGNVTLVATWSIDTFSIFYNLNNGDIEGQPTDSFTVESQDIVLPTPFRNGYGFEGWFIDPSFSSGPISVIAQGSVGNYDLYAKWELTVYTIEYVLDGGTNGSNPQSYTVENNNFTLDDPSKEYHVFNGWYDNPEYIGNAVTYVDTSECRDLVFYAFWIAYDYSITYEYNGGEAVDNPNRYAYGTPTFGINPTTRTGYHFDGWFDNAGLTGVPIAVIECGSHTNYQLYAGWTLETYYITYELDGGSTTDNPKTYTWETGIDRLEPSERDGYRFTGWYDPDGNRYDSIGANTITGDLTLHAGWIKRVTVSYVVDGETISSSVYDSGRELSVRAQYTKHGYTADPWTTTDVNVDENGSYVLGESDVTFTTVCHPIPYGYTVRYQDPEGNSLHPDLVSTAPYGSTVTPQLITIDGYSPVSAEMQMVISTDEKTNIIVYEYTINQYFVRYIVGNETLFEDSFDYGTIIDVREPYTLTGYTVSGWDTQDVQIEDGRFTLGSSDVTFRATSTVNKYGYTVSYTDDFGKVLADAFVGLAEYGSNVDAPLAQIRGYTVSTQPKTITIGEDETANTAVYVYTIDKHNVYYIVDNDTVFTDIFDYGTETEVRDQYSKADCTVTTWYSTDVAISNGKFVVPDHDVTFRATSVPNNVYGTASDLEWHYNRNTRVLEVYGNGALEISQEWSQFAIADAIIGEGVTSITGNPKNWSPMHLVLPSTVTSVSVASINTNLLRGVEVDAGNTSYASADGILFDKEMTSLLLYPQEKYDFEYTLPDTVKSVASASFSESKLTVIYIPDGVTFGTNALRNCGSLSKLVLDGADVAFEANSIVFTDNKQHPIEVCAPEGFLIPQGAYSGNVVITYTVLKHYDLIEGDAADPNWGADIGIGIMLHADSPEELEQSGISANNIPGIIVNALCPELQFSNYSVSVDTIDMDIEQDMAIIASSFPYVRSDVILISMNGSITFTFTVFEPYSFGDSKRYSFDGLNASAAVLNMDTGDKVTIVANVNLSMFSDRIAHFTRYDGSEYPYLYLDEVQNDHYRGYVDFESVKVVNYSGTEREFVASSSSEDFVFSYIKDYDPYVRYGGTHGVGTESTDGSGTFFVKVGDSVYRYSPILDVYYQREGNSATSGVKLPDSFPDNYKITSYSEMKDYAERAFAVHPVSPDTAVVIEQTENRYTITVSETASSVTQSAVAVLVESAEKDSAVTLTVAASAGTISLDNTALRNLKSEECTIKLETMDPKPLGLQDDAIVLDIKIGDNHTNFGGGTITVTVPYTGSFEGKKAFYIVDGKPVESYDIRDNGNGTISFDVKHLSTFAITDSSFGESPSNDGGEFPILYVAIGAVVVLALAGGAIAVKKRRS